MNSAPPIARSFDASALEQAIFTLLTEHSLGVSICPSEAARAVYKEEVDWRAAMHVVRALAADLALQKRIEITQAGQLVDINEAKGPIRLRLAPS